MITKEKVKKTHHEIKKEPASSTSSAKALENKSEVKKAAEGKPSIVKISTSAKATEVKKVSADKQDKKGIQSKEIKKYIYSTGGRKEAKVQLKLFLNGEGKFLVNNKEYEKYFPYFEFQKIVSDPLKQLGLKGKFDIIVRVTGGGVRGQAEAIRYALSHALVKFNSEFRKTLKKIKFLSRDSRVKERKKFGLKKARRAPQWQKR